jgi:hypothetical protein
MDKINIKNGNLKNIIIDEKTLISSDLESQIFLVTFFEPMTDYTDFLKRVAEKQIMKILGNNDNPLSKFY